MSQQFGDLLPILRQALLEPQIIECIDEETARRCRNIIYHQRRAAVQSGFDGELGNLNVRVEGRLVKVRLPPKPIVDVRRAG